MPVYLSPIDLAYGLSSDAISCTEPLLDDMDSESPVSFSTPSFTRPFLPELRAIILDFLDRPDILNYSLCCKEFNSESARLVWSIIDIPGFGYTSHRGDYKTVYRALTRFPARGKYVKTLTFLCTYDILLRNHVEWNEDYFDCLEHMLDLMPNVESMTMMRSIAIPRGGRENLANIEKIGTRVYGIMFSWFRRTRVKRFKSVYATLAEVLPMIKCCPGLTHLSVQLPPLGIPALSNYSIIPLTSSDLPLLSHLEVDIQTLPLFTSPSRNITNIRILPGAQLADATLLTAAGTMLGESNAVEILQFTNLPSYIVGCILSQIARADSLRVVVEMNKRPSDEPYEGEDWAYELLRIVENLPSLETYVVHVAPNCNFSEHRVHSSYAGGHMVEIISNFLNEHLPLGCSPRFQHFVVLETGHLEGPDAEYWMVKRDNFGKWQVIRNEGWQSGWLLGI